MRDLDVGRFLRLRNAIQQSMEAVTEDVKAYAGSVLLEAYSRFHEDALMLVPQDDLEQLLKVCPDVNPQRIGQIRSGPGSGSDQAKAFVEAKVLLGGLAGFLDGYVEENRMRVEAEEKARLAAEAGGLYL